MKKIHRPSPGWLRYFAFSLLLIVGGLSAYGFIYVAQHEDQLNEHYLKLLLAAAEYSEDTLERLDQNVANALADKSLLNADSVEVDEKIRTSLKGIAALDPGSVSLNLADTVLAALEVSAMDTVARRVQVVKQGKQARLRFYLARYFEQFENKARFAAEADLHELLTPLFPREGFDAFVIAEESGNVLVYEGTGSLMLLALPLDALLPAATHADAERADNYDAPMTSSYVVEVRIAGVGYRMFLQPIRVPMVINGEQQTWILAGLKRAAVFQAETRSIPPNTLLGLLGLFVIVLLALPFLKVRLIGEREQLRGHDVFVMIVALVVVSSTITFGVLEYTTYTQFIGEREDNLKALAANIDSTISAEVDLLDQQLRALTKQRSERLDTLGKGLPIRGHLLADDGGTLLSYPFLDQAIWLDSTGQQIEKWSVKAQPTPSISVADRQYFLQAYSEALWHPEETCAPPSLLVFADPEPVRIMHARPTASISVADRQYFLQQRRACAPSSDSLTRPGRYIESIRSKNTGRVLAVLSHRLNEENNHKAAVATASVRLMSVVRPVLSPGQRFCIIAQDGTVLFHSDDARNLRENLFEEISEAASLRAAVLGHAKMSFDATYHGTMNQFHLKPLSQTPWSLLVFADLEPVRIVHAQLILQGMLLYFLYLVALVVLLVGIRLRPGSQRSITRHVLGLWPEEKKTATYVFVVLAEMVMGGVWLLILLLLFPENPPLGVLCTTILGALGLLLSFLLARAPRKPKHHREPLKSRLPKGGRRSLEALQRYWRRGYLPNTMGARRFLKVQQRNWRGWYVTSVLGLVVLVGMLPPVAIYRAVHDEAMQLYIKNQHLETAQRVLARFEAQVTRYQSLRLSDAHQARIDGLLFPSRLHKDSIGGWLPWDIHLNKGWRLQVTNTRLADTTPIMEHLIHTFHRLAPGPGHELHMLAHHPADKLLGWRWKDDARKNTLVLQMRVPRRTAGRGVSQAEEPFVYLETAAPVPRFHGLVPWGALLLIFGLVLAGLWWLIRSMTRRAYLIDMLHPCIVEGAELQPELGSAMPHRLVLRGDVQAVPGVNGQLFRADDAHHVDSTLLRQNGSLGELLEAAKISGKENIVVNHFHRGLEDPEMAREKLQLLEGLLALDDRRIEVHADINPLYYFRMLARDRFRLRRDATEAEPDLEVEPDLERWSAALASFRRVRHALHRKDLEQQVSTFEKELRRYREEKRRPSRDAHPLDENAKATGRVLRMLAEECWPDARLRDIGRMLAVHPHLARLDDRQHINNQVLDLAEAYYQQLWSISSKAEKLILYWVSTDGFINWRMGDLVRRLIYRGLLHATPHFRLMNESFRHFVRNAELPEVFEAWEKEAGASGWALLKVPVGVALLGLIAFIFTTAPDVIDQSLGIITALAAGLPALIKVALLVFQWRPSAP